MGEVRVIESDSFWSRLKTTCSETRYIIAGIVIVLIIATIIAVAVIFTGGSSSGDVAIDYSKALIVTDEWDLWALDLNSQKQIKLANTSKGIGAFDYYKKNTIYWHENGSPWVNSLSKKYHNLTQTRKWDPKAIAVDYVSEKVYVIDGFAGKLNVYDSKSASFGIAVSDLKNPVDIALDPSRGLMFIVQHLNSILKGNMDGTSLEIIIASCSATSITIDTQTPKIYWTDLMKIESSDYNGNNRQVVVRISGTGMNLGVSGNRLFLTIPSKTALERRTLLTCTMKNGACTEDDFEKIPFDDPKVIKVFTDEMPAISNPCKEANGACEQLCLLKANSGHSCACYVGYKLKDDGKSCTRIDEFLLYTRGNFVRGRILDSDKESFTDAILPIGIHRDILLDNKKTVNFDYNFHTSTFVFSDDRSINTINLLKNDLQGMYTGKKCIKYVSFDWVTNDIYYVKDNCDNAENTKIVVLRQKMDTYFWKTLQSFSYDQGHPKSLVVHPNSGSYFFTMLLKGKAQIYKVRGLKKMLFSEEISSVNETGLTIDFIEDKLYWFNQNTTILHNANLDGTDIQSIDVSVVKEPISVSIYDRYMYVANLTSIWRFDKPTGRGAMQLVHKIGDDAMIAGVKVYSAKVEKVRDNLCFINNGDCQQFCFRQPRIKATKPNTVNVTDELRKICLCEDYRTIQPDGKSCL